MNLVIILLYFSALVAANTEIINFDASSKEQNSIASPVDAFSLGAHGNEKSFELVPAPLGFSPEANPGKMWLVLNLTSAEWTPYTKFTLRVSWPADHPTDFYIDLFDARDAHGSKYASISAIDSGILTPNPNSNLSNFRRPVVFDAILEPLYLGILPESVFPLVLLLVLLLVVLPFVISRIHGHLSQMALQARKEIELKKRP